MTKSAHMYFHRMAKTYHELGKQFMRVGMPAKAHTYFALRRMMIDRRKLAK